jgi:PAS domain S-box-containing protein
VTKYKLNLYLPLVFVVLFFSTTTVILTYFLQDRAIYQEKKTTITNFNTMLQKSVEDEAGMLTGYLNIFKDDKQLQDIFVSSDKKRLYEYIKNRYIDLNKNIELTHLYFIQKDGKVLLRGHDYDRDSDIIDRYTFKKAKQTQKPYYGLEFGIKKNYTLRVVHPWIVDGNLIGYIEMGKEIDKVISTISSLLKTEVYLAVDKEIYKDAPKFVKKKLEKTYRSNTHYIVYNTFDIPDKVEDKIFDNSKIEFRDKIFTILSSDLIDVSSKKLGHFIFLADVTVEYEILYSAIQLLVIVLIIITTIMILIGGKYLKNKENDINRLTNQLDSKNEFLERLIETAPVPIYFKDTSKRFIHINDAFLDTFGYSKSQVVGYTNSDIEDISRVDYYNSKDDELISNPEHMQVYETKWEDENHDIKSLVSYRSAFYNPDGTIGGIIGIIYNITEQKKLEVELKEFNERLTEQVDKEVSARLQVEKEKKEQEQLLIQQSKMASMGEMIGAIAHQWRQPLNSLSITKDLLIDDYYEEALDDTKVEKFESKMNNLIQYMSKTIDDFRNFFLPSKEKCHFNLYKEITSIYDIVSAQLSSNNITLSISSNEKHIDLYSYPNEFKQVIINIINNAKDAIVKQMKNKAIKKGSIDINISKEDNTLKITISDNGGGMSEEVINKVFEPYFTTKFEAQGTGLGLYMAKTIIEKNMNGQLTCHNIENGAIFTISIDLKTK